MAKKRIETIFTEEQFKKADRLSKIHIARLQPDFVEKLNNTDYEYKDILESIMPIVLSDMPMHLIVADVKRRYPTMWGNQISQAIRDAQQLFAAYMVVQPDVLRGVMRETLLENISVLKKIRDNAEAEDKDRIKASEAIIKAVHTISMTNGLNKPNAENDDFEPFDEVIADDIQNAEYEEIIKQLEAADTADE